MITDPMLIRIGQAVQLNHQGEREAARLEFEAIWDEIGGEQGDPLHVCTLAHAMADAQDDLREELLWDLRALSAADLLTDARMRQAGVGLPAGGLYPSLHLNLSECYRSWAISTVPVSTSSKRSPRSARWVTTSTGG